MTRTSRRAAAAWLLLMSTASGCTLGESGAPRAGPATATAAPSDSPSRGTPVLSFDFDDLGALTTARAGTGALTLHNAGSEPVTARVSAVGGGTLRSMPDHDGGFAARFPAYARGSGERVVLTITSSSVTDPLSPGTSDFTFGAAFAIDNVTEGEGLDNGNNLVQRGLSGDAAQYKLQIDQGRVSCFIAGDAGEVIVKTKQRIRSHTWYRASCTRTGPVVTLTVETLGEAPERAVEPGDTGALYVSSATPVVLGGKATSTGQAVVGDSDQLNGALDNVFLEIDEES